MGSGPATPEVSAARLRDVSDGRARDGPSVFISYRRSDTRDVVAPLAELLRRDLGGEQVFRDEDDLIAGERFNDVIRDRLNSSDAALFVIGPGWESSSGDVRRIDEVDDPVRFEVELAIAEDCRATPVPVVVDRTEVPTGPPSCTDELFAHHSVRASRSDLYPVPGDAYQEILVGVWAAIRDRLNGAMLVIADNGDGGTVAIDRFLKELAADELTGARELSRFASGAAIVALTATKAAQTWPDVVLLVNEATPSPTMSARIHAVAAHPALKATALIGIGATSSSAAALAAQSFSTATEWIAQANTNAFGFGRRLLRGFHARPRVAAAALLGAAAVGGALVLLSLDERVNASVEHAGFEIAVSDARTDPLPHGWFTNEEDPDPEIDHREIQVRMRFGGVPTDSTVLVICCQNWDHLFDLELANGTVIPAEGGWDSGSEYFEPNFLLSEFEEPEVWVSFPVPRGIDTGGAELRIHFGDVVPSVLAMDSGKNETSEVPVTVMNPVYEGPYGFGAENRVRIEVGDVTASYEAGFDDKDGALPSPDFGHRRRAEDGYVLVRYEATETEIETNSSLGTSYSDTARAVVDGEEISDRAAGPGFFELETAPTTYRGVIEVPVDATSIGIGFVSWAGPAGEQVYYVADLDPSFLEEFREH